MLSGGNVDPLLLIKLIDHGLSAAGRYLQLRVLLDDRPGNLAGLTQAVAELGLNVLAVEHHREGLALALDEVEVLLTLETRDPLHHAEIVEAPARPRLSGRAPPVGATSREARRWVAADVVEQRVECDRHLLHRDGERRDAMHRGPQTRWPRAAARHR